MRSALQTLRDTDERRLALGQLLIKERILSAERYLLLMKAAERKLFECSTCGARYNIRTFEHREDPPCLECGEELALPDDFSELSDAELHIEGGSQSQTPKQYFGNYEILSVLGEGGMGVVYRARQMDLGRDVALKMLRSDQAESHDQVRRFQREAEAAARLEHKNIVTVHDFGNVEGRYYITMEFIDGETLYQRLIRETRFEEEETLHLVSTIARAVHYAHGRGIVHRDLKPGNIILDVNDDEPKITDFGLAKYVDTSIQITRSGIAVGTPLYMSPEQAQGNLKEVDFRSDIFSLGTLLYHMMTGQLPFTGTSHLEIYNRIIYDPPVSPRELQPDMSADLETVILKCLAKRRADRYQTGEELALELEAIQAGESIQARPPSLAERTYRWARRRAGLLVGGFLVLLLGLLTLLYVRATLSQQEAEALSRSQRKEWHQSIALLDRLAASNESPDAILEQVRPLAARYPGTSVASRATCLEGLALLRNGNRSRALETLAGTFGELRREEWQIRCLLGMSRALFEAGRFREARKAAEAVIVRGGDEESNRRAQQLRGRALARLAEFEAATQALRGAGPATLETTRTREWIDVLAPARRLTVGARTAVAGQNGALWLARSWSLVRFVLEGGELRPETRIPLPRGSGTVEEMVFARLQPDGSPILCVLCQSEGPGPRLLVFDPDTGRRLGDDILPGTLATGSVAVSDTDGNGREELFFGMLYPPGGIYHWELTRGGLGRGRPLSRDMEKARTEVLSLTAGPDGLYSVSQSGTNYDLRLWDRTGPDTFRVVAQERLSEPVRRLVLLSGPGGRRLLTVQGSDGTDHLFLHPSGGTIQASPAQLPTSLPGPIGAVRVHDVNRDGELDLIYVRNPESEEPLVVILPSVTVDDPPEGFSLALQGPIRECLTVDLDRNGRKDLVVIGKDVTWLFGVE